MALRFWMTLGLVTAAGAGASHALVGCSSNDDKKNAAGEVDAGDATTTTDDAGVPGSDGGPSGDAGPPPTPRSACEQYLHAACQRRVECGLGGSVASCEALSAYCPDYFFAPGSTRTVEGMIACAEVRRTQPCEEVERGIDPACATPGTRQAGEPCVVSGQCASQRCSMSYGCGTCLAIKAPGTGCPGPAETCGQNKECTSADAGCVPIPVPERLAAGASCSLDAGPDAGQCGTQAPCAANAAQATDGTCSARPASGPCLFRLGQAFASVCSFDTTCLRVDPGIAGGECVPPGGKDALCGTGYGGRGCAEGFFCTDITKGTCQPRHKDGESCSVTTQCEDAFYCARPTAALGTCVARSALGAPCGTTMGDAGIPYTVECAAGLTCKQVSSGDGSFDDVCVQTGGIGAPCGAPHQDCYGTLECRGGMCMMQQCPVDAGPG